MTGAERAGAVQPGEDFRETLKPFQCLRRTYKRAGEGLLQGPGVTGQGGMASN